MIIDTVPSLPQNLHWNKTGEKKKHIIQQRTIIISHVNHKERAKIVDIIPKDHNGLKDTEITAAIRLMTCTSASPCLKKFTSCGFTKVIDKEIPDICKMSKKIVQTNKYVLCTQPCIPTQKGRWQGGGRERKYRTTYHHIQANSTKLRHMGLLSCFSRSARTHTQGRERVTFWTRLVVLLGRVMVSFKLTQVSFWVTSPHLSHFNCNMNK